MRVPRVHVADAAPGGAPLELPAERSHYLLDVLRLQPGDPLQVFDGAGNEWRAQIVAGGKRARLQVGDAVEAGGESPLAIVLWQGLSQSSRMDACLRQAVELGVSAVRPLATRRSQARLDAKRAEKRLAHWRAIAISACEQCGRATVPRIHPLLTLEAALSDRDGERVTSLMLLPEATTGLGEIGGESRPERIDLLIGPESGLDPTEIDAASAAGFRGVRAGPRVLRTETAGPAALAVLQARLGDLGT